MENLITDDAQDNTAKPRNDDGEDPFLPQGWIRCSSCPESQESYVSVTWSHCPRCKQEVKLTAKASYCFEKPSVVAVAAKVEEKKTLSWYAESMLERHPSNGSSNDDSNVDISMRSEPEKPKRYPRFLTQDKAFTPEVLKAAGVVLAKAQLQKDVVDALQDADALLASPPPYAPYVPPPIEPRENGNLPPESLMTQLASLRADTKGSRVSSIKAKK